RKLAGQGVEDVFAIDITDAGRTDGTVERDSRDCQRGRRADHGSNIRVDLGVDRYGVHDDLNIVIEALGKQGAQRTVDQARCEGFFFRRTALTLEEPTGDTSRCIRFLDVVDGQGEKVLPGFGLLGSNNGSQNDGVSNRSQYG